jgi:hypothetical protein
VPVFNVSLPLLRRQAPDRAFHVLQIEVRDPGSKGDQ